MYLNLILALSCISQVFSLPVTTLSNTTQCTAPCEWTQWFNVDHPHDQIDSGDFETLENIRAQGYNVCRAPRDIRCRSVRFPYIPHSELLYKSNCDPEVGLICRNKDNEANCVDFEVQLLCCPCDQVNGTQNVTTIPSVSPESPATQCGNPRCSWTQWFNSHKPTLGPDGGEFENITTIRQQGYAVCNSPVAIQCRLERFPYVPLKELYYVQECSVPNGLVCLHNNQQDGKCKDYEVQFLCCVCDPSTPNKSLTIPKVTTNPISLVPSGHPAHETPTTMEVTPTTKYMFTGPEHGSGMLPNVN